jgi:hypothetical protein
MDEENKENILREGSRSSFQYRALFLKNLSIQQKLVFTNLCQVTFP